MQLDIDRHDADTPRAAAAPDPLTDYNPQIVATAAPAAVASRPADASPPAVAAGLDRGQPRPTVASFLLSAVISLVCGAVGAWAYTNFAPDRGGDRDRTAAPAVRDGDRQANSGEAGADAATPEADDHKADLDRLAGRVDSLQSRLNAMLEAQQANTEPVDLNKIHEELGVLSNAVDTVGRQTERLGILTDRVDAIDLKLNTLRDEVASSKKPKGQSDGLAAPTSPAPAEPRAASPTTSSASLRTVPARGNKPRVRTPNAPH